MEADMKKCPACAEEIKAEAKKCRYCGEVFEIIQNEDNKLIETIKNLVLNSDTKWSIRDKSESSINFLYIIKDEKASCGTACCLGCLFFPIAIIYALIGGKKGKEKQVLVEINNGKVTLSGDPYYYMKIYDILSKNNIEIEETDKLKTAKTWRLFLRK